MNFRSFSLHHDYSYPLTLSNAGKPSWFEFQGTISKSRKINKISSLNVYVLHRTRNYRHFHVVVVEKRQRNVQKSTMYARSYCFAYQTYFYVLVAVASLDLKVPIDVLDINGKNWPIIGYTGGGTPEWGIENRAYRLHTYPSLPSAPRCGFRATFLEALSLQDRSLQQANYLSTNNFMNLIALSRVF